MQNHYVVKASLVEKAFYVYFFVLTVDTMSASEIYMYMADHIIKDLNSKNIEADKIHLMLDITLLKSVNL